MITHKKWNARRTCLFYYWFLVFVDQTQTSTCQPKTIQRASHSHESQYIKWYLDSKCLFFQYRFQSGPLFARLCVRPRSERIWATGIIFFQTIDLLLLPYFEWLYNNGFHVIDLKPGMLIEYCVYGTRVIQQNFVTQQIKVLTLRIIIIIVPIRFSFYFVICGQKRGAPLKLRNSRRMWIPAKKSLRKAIFCHEIWVACPMSIVHRAKPK